MLRHTPSARLLAAFVAVGGAAATIVSPSQARAQVTTNSTALDALGNGTAAPSSDRAAGTDLEHATNSPPSASTTPHHAAHASRAQPHASSSGPAAPQSTPTPVSGTAPHAAAPLPPPLVSPPPPVPLLTRPTVDVPLHPAPMPPPPAFEPDAPGERIALPDNRGIRITYGEHSAALNNTTNGALAGDVAELIKAHPESRVEIDAFASGDKGDESAARRLSLQRGLGVRSALMHEGVAATRIYVRALGTQHPPGLPGEGAAAGTAKDAHLSPDRVDLMLVGPDAPVPAAATSSEGQRP